MYHYFRGEEEENPLFNLDSTHYKYEFIWNNFKMSMILS